MESFRLAAVAVVLLLTLVTGANGTASCNECYGRGTIAYEGTYYCRCVCVENRTTAADGTTLVATFLPPDCRYTVSQAERVRVTVATSLSGFVWPRFANGLVTNMGLDPSTATVHRIRMVNVSAEVFHIDLEFRDDGAPISTLPPATYARQRLLQDFASQESWVSNLRIADVASVSQSVGPANSDPAIVATIGGLDLAWETLVLFICLLLVPFVLLFGDMIATDNFIADDEAGKQLLEEYQAIKAGRRASEIVSVGAAARPPVEAEEKPEWVVGDNPPDEPESSKPLQRKGTRSLRDYSANFYASVQPDDEL